jgi:hypothetical protein
VTSTFIELDEADRIRSFTVAVATGRGAEVARRVYVRDRGMA